MTCDGFGSLAPQSFCRHVLRAIWGDRAEKFGQLSPIELGALGELSFLSLPFEIGSLKRFVWLTPFWNVMS